MVTSLPLSEREIREHSAWMRRLAQALVRDDASADDVVQEAWTKVAGQSTPTGAGYLAAVVRSLALTRLRGERRRGRREAASAREEALPSAADVAARVEVARRVGEALERLPEPYRTTLVLRYFDELSSAEIARRAGVPAATVRARLKRGLEQLRERLDEREGGRAAWLAALVPWSRPTPVAGAIAVPGITALLAMKLALVGLLAALAVTLAWPLLSREDGHDRSTGVAAAAVRPAAVATDHADGRVASSETSARHAVEAPALDVPTAPVVPVASDVFRVTARAIDERGRALDGAWLELAGIGERSAPSGPDGRIELALSPVTLAALAGADRQWALVLSVGAPRQRVESRITYLSEEALELALGDVELAPGASVSGRVLDADGLAQAGARVVFAGPPPPGMDLALCARRGPNELFANGLRSEPAALVARTARDGTFRIDGVPPGYGCVWAASSGSRWGWSELVGLRAGDERGGLEVQIELAPGEGIAGRVLDPDGAPVRGAKVQVLATDGSTGWTDLRSDNDGAFHFVVPEGLAQDITVESPVWEWDAIAVRSVEPGTGQLELRFARSAWWEVAVLATDGAPVRAGTVEALPAEGPTQFAVLRSKAALDAEGRARLRCQAEPLRVRVTAPGFRAVVLGPFEAESFPAPLTVTLERLPALVGRVLDDAGAPVSGARVTLHQGPVAGRLDRHGSRFSDQGFTGDRPAFVYVLRPEPLCATTTDALGRYALALPGVDASAQAEVALAADELTAAFNPPRVDEIARSTPETPWYLHAEVADNTGTTLGPLHFEGAMDVEVELRLPRTGAIDGRLVLEPAGSCVGWTVHAADGRGGFARAPVDASGGFHMQGLAPGPWQLSAFEPGRPFRGLGRIRTAREPVTDLTVLAQQTVEYVHRAERRPSARLAGHVLVDGAPPGAWRVEVRTELRVGWNDSTTALLDPDGRFQVRFEPGTRSRVLLSSLTVPGFGAGFEVPIHPGLNEWSIAFATARLDGRLPPAQPSRPGMDGMVYRVDLEGGTATSSFRVDDEGHFGPLVVASGKGKLLGPSPNMRDPAPVLVELDLAPGETRAIDLREP